MIENSEIHTVMLKPALFLHGQTENYDTALERAGLKPPAYDYTSQCYIPQICAVEGWFHGKKHGGA
jgi:hypothetical protein